MRHAMCFFPLVVMTQAPPRLAAALALAEEEGVGGVQVLSYDRAMKLCARTLGLGAPLA